MKNFFVLLAALLLPVILFAQNGIEPYEKDWKKADSLLEKGLPQSAVKIAQSVYEKARQKGQDVQMMKAQLYIMTAEFQWNEEAFRKALQTTEKNIDESRFPNNAVWQSIAAELYWHYYQQHRWKILQRTTVSASSNIEDFEQWDARRFFDKISTLYKASLLRSADLEQIKIEQYDPLLVKGVNSRNLRPTLFDLLAFRAVQYFENDEKEATKPAFSFVMNDARAFAPAADFVKADFQTRDTSSLQWHALKLYQRILSLHMNDAMKDALIDADLHRLQFAHSKSVHPDKDKLYLQALEYIEQQYSSNSLSALAGVRIAQQMMGTERTRMDYDQEFGEMETPPRNYPAIVQRLEQVIAKHPKSEGGTLARQLLQQIKAKELTLTAEEVVLPDEYSKILVNYRNVGEAWIRVVKLKRSDEDIMKGHYQRGEQGWEKKLMQSPVIEQWKISLPSAADYERHAAEVKINNLPAGAYAVIISTREDFNADDNLLSYAIFQASALSLVMHANNNGYVLNRKTGMPISDAFLDVYTAAYNRNTYYYDLTKAATLKSNAEGMLTFTQKDVNYHASRIRYKGDTLSLMGHFSHHTDRHEEQPQTQTFFFTDRSIYRPGQTIHFKGIVVRKEKGGKSNNVIPNRATEVTFYDANGQKIASQKLTTNEYGSVSGSFTAPDGVLTGSMHISDGHGSAYFSVEEYKRPKFSVSFDTMQKAYALNETITVQGKATAFAGNNIDNATVKYRVVRNARFPYWWYSWRWGFPRSAQMEITSGTTTTDANGNFKIDFKAIPDPAIDPQSLPVFTYTVTADVTDINGETRSGSTSTNIGYTSIQIAVNTGEQVRPSDVDTLNISTTNLNGQFKQTDVQLRISKLKEPGTVLRKRLWQKPDQFIMDSVTFKSYFPNDVYNDEDNHLKWSEQNTVLDRSIKTTKDGNVAIPIATWKTNGWYVIEITATDKSGKKLTEKKYIQVWSPENTGKTSQAIAAVPQLQTVEPGNTARVHLVSGYGNLHVLRQVASMNDQTAVTHMDYTGAPIVWTKQITEADRGRVTVNYVTVKENRFYYVQSFVQVPWSNKDLDISWETHRDKLKPGEKETWTMVVRGNKKDKVAAEMVATLYDASLDVFKPHDWEMYELFPTQGPYQGWSGMGLGVAHGTQVNRLKGETGDYYEKSYDRLRLLMNAYGGYDGDHVMYKRTMAAGNAVMAESSAESLQSAKATVQFTPPAIAADMSAEETQAGNAAAQDRPAQSDVIQPRTNLRETAFFLPHLKTDAEGNVRIEFTMPEALTEWKLMTFAHTKDMRTGKLEGKVKTQKDVMVMPNLPRFLRQGDEIIISTKISNLSDQDQSGTATLELLNATTMQPVHLPFRLQTKDVAFTAKKGQSATASWTLHVPESMYQPVVIRILARAGNFTDGEETTVPVVTNRMQVTETLPLWINGDGTKNFSFDKLNSADTSKTLQHLALTLEYTSNPAWLAVLSLPTLIEPKYENAEQVFNKYYAVALASHIVAKAPKIKAVFDKWNEEAMFSSFKSPLENNQELKTALLQETPWVLEAQNEAEQRKRIGQLFETYKLSKELDAAVRKLKDMQLPDGSFPWFKGMRSDRYITQYIITGLGRLQHLGVQTANNDMRTVISKALPYLDAQMKQGYDQLVKNKAKMEEQHIGHTEIQYLYMRSFFKQEVGAAGKKAFDYYMGQANRYWSEFNPYMKGMIALVLHRNGNKQTTPVIIQSLKETAMRKEEMGMYWMERGYGYWWYQAPIEAQSLLIEAFKEVANDNASVDAMKIWLLKNKQTQSWETSKATADACYALLLSGTDWLVNEPAVTVQLGNKTVKSSDQQLQAGTGYFKVRYDNNEIPANAGNVKLTVDGNDKSTSWGAVYWQYFEDMDKITSAKTPLEVKKQLFIERNTDRGPVLEPVTANNPLRIGDKVKARIEIIVDRDMEYVHLKDMRASAFEPVNVLSGYKWANGLGYYESTKDLSTSFFFDYLRKGKYVFEYPMFVSQAGEFSNGIATIQCMYAPEFSSHSEGVRVQVK